MRRTFSKTPLLAVIVGTAILYQLTSCAYSKRFGDDAGKGEKATSGRTMINKTAGLHSDTLTVDGKRRDFSFYVPSNSANMNLPIVIYLHGLGDNMRHLLGLGFLKSASAIWMDVAERERFLVFYPLGLKGEGHRGKTGWNDCRKDAKGNPKTNDLKFIRELINFAVSKQQGDRKRVYVTGMSNGGHMAMRVAMEMSGEVAAVAPVVALLPISNKCSLPTLPVPILMMHGTADPFAPYEGGYMPKGRGEVYSARETAKIWAKWNGLENVIVKTEHVLDISSSDNSKIVIHTREASLNGSAVIAYEIQGAGHTEPSRDAKMNRLLKRVQGNQNNDIEMAVTIWDFMKTRSR